MFDIGTPDRYKKDQQIFKALNNYYTYRQYPVDYLFRKILVLQQNLYRSIIVYFVFLN